MTVLPPAHLVLRKNTVTAPPHDLVVLTYDERILRRKRLITAHDQPFIVDLAETISVDHGDCFQLQDGRLIEVVAAAEDVLVITGDLPRLAWHIGNRHTPCQIGPDALVIRADHVLAGMLAGLGAQVTPARAPFRPEGGAYGLGRTMGHGDNQHGY